MNVKDILTRARDRIAKPENWCQVAFSWQAPADLYDLILDEYDVPLEEG